VCVLLTPRICYFCPLLLCFWTDSSSTWADFGINVSSSVEEGLPNGILLGGWVEEKLIPF